MSHEPLMLQVRNLMCSLAVGSQMSFRQKKKQVLNGVSISIEKGRTVGLLGGSGSGKSTLARCIAGLQKPDGGEIAFNGIEFFPRIENRQKFPLDIQMLFQAISNSLNPMMTVRQCVEEGIEAQMRAKMAVEKSTTAEELITSVGIGVEVLDRFPAQLSGGQRQRVALARVIAVQPQLLILDEPTSALDTITQMQVLSLLKTLQEAQRFSILFITHDVHTAFMLCDRIAILHEGSIIEEGAVNDLLKRQNTTYTQQLFASSGISC